MSIIYLALLINYLVFKKSHLFMVINIDDDDSKRKNSYWPKKKYTIISKNSEIKQINTLTEKKTLFFNIEGYDNRLTKNETNIEIENSNTIIKIKEFFEKNKILQKLEADKFSELQKIMIIEEYDNFYNGKIHGYNIKKGLDLLNDFNE
jgi:hypothetical protein